MSKRSVLMFLVLTMTLSLVGMSATAIDLSTLASFLYQGSTYVPLKSTASILGVPLRWDADTGQAIMTYQGQDLALKPYSRNATYAGRSVVLNSQPIMVNGVTYVPADTFKKYYNVPVTLDRSRSELRIKGPNGWRTMKANSRPPWHGGPPPWAPAWGQRRNATPGYSMDGKGPAWGHRTKGHMTKVKVKGNGEVKTWGKPGYDKNGHKIKIKSNGKGNTKGWGQRGYNMQDRPGNGKANGNGKSKGDKKDR